MSGLVYPNFLAGKMLTQRRTPTWSTKPQRALSGKESRISYRAYPLYEWELQYEFLDDRSSRTNYLPWSQDFTQWTPVSGGAGLPPVVVGTWVGSTAPDGTYTADRVILNVAAGTLGSDYSQVVMVGVVVPNSAGILTFSIWLKTNDGTSRGVSLYCGSNGVNLTVTPVWTRFSLNVSGGVPGAGNVPNFLVFGNVGSKYADLSVWGAQLELGALATYPYIATFGAGVVTSDLQTITGFFNRMMGQYDTFLYQDPDFNAVTQQQFATGNGVQTLFNLTATYMPGNSFGTPDGLAGQPEWIQNTLGAPLIYTNRYGAPELLSTAGRTNFALQSNFAATWGVINATKTNNAAVAPDGTSTAAQITDTTANAAHAVTQGSIAIAASQRYTFSVWLKHTNHQYVGLIFDDGSSNGIGVIVDLVNNVLSNIFILGTAYADAADATLTAFPNGWIRVSLSGQQMGSVTTVRIDLQFSQNLTTQPWSQVYAGSGSDTFYCWGAQLETGTQPNALIPTTTTTVTVGADYSLTNLSTFGNVETFAQVSFAIAPANGVALTWSGSFLYRVRFSEDKQEFKEQYGRRIWTLDKLSMEQVFL
jgi:Conserved hypothetical protein 2217 (DUF2460)